MKTDRPALSDEYHFAPRINFIDAARYCHRIGRELDWIVRGARLRSGDGKHGLRARAMSRIKDAEELRIYNPIQ